ncbi:hypothetical protein D3C75_1108350 [compost metagenome]
MPDVLPAAICMSRAGTTSVLLVHAGCSSMSSGAAACNPVIASSASSDCPVIDACCGPSALAAAASQAS